MTFFAIYAIIGKTVGSKTVASAPGPDPDGRRGIVDYGFFDYKYNIAGHESDLFSAPHIVFIVLVYLLTFAVSYFLRNTKREKITVFLRVFSVVMVLWETTKVTWESYYDITTGQGFNFEGLLPVYTCSLFIYTLLFAAWGKGKAKEAALSFLTTISLLFGAIGVVYCNGLNFYPFWTFGAFYSLFFHTSMFSVGVFLLMSGYKKLNFRDVFSSFIPVLLLAVVAIPINYTYGADYMLLYSGSGVPLYQDLAAKLAEAGVRYIYTYIMLLTHLPLSALVVGIYQGIDALVRRVQKKRLAAR